MKKYNIGILILLSLIISATAQTNINTNVVTHMYRDSIQIKGDNGANIANIDIDGRIMIASNSSVDEVINILIKRMVLQNIQYKEQIDQLLKIIQNYKFNTDLTVQKLNEITTALNPPPPKIEVKKVEKKSFWNRLFRR